MQIQFLAVGELLADLVTTTYTNSLAEAKDFQMYQGGSPSNVAANLRWLGKHAELVASVGTDTIGDFLLAEIKKAGLSGAYVQRNKELPSSLVLVTKSQGTPDFLAYRLADAHLEPVDEALILQSTILHTTAFALSRNPARNNILQSLKAARQANRIVSIDWNFAPQVWGDNNGRQVFQKLMSLKPLLKISMDDLSRFAGTNDVDSAKAFLDPYDATTCLTAGKDGVFYKQHGGAWKHAAALPLASIVDTTGAGDAFWAGFISALIDGAAMDNCVAMGQEIAAKKLQKQGPLYQQ